MLFEDTCNMDILLEGLRRKTAECTVQQGVMKKQKYFLSPADFTLSAFMYEESKTPIARLQTLNLRNGTIGL